MLACCLMAAAWSLTSASASGNVWANTPGNKRNERKNGRIGTSDSNRSIVPPAPIRAATVRERLSGSGPSRDREGAVVGRGVGQDGILRTYCKSVQPGAALQLCTKITEI